MQNIVTVAEHTPDVRHWLPTRETTVVKTVGQFPQNLVVRVSGQRIDGKPPKGFAHTSTVVSTSAGGSAICPAPDQGARCGNCRNCWNPEVKNVAYRLH